MIKDMVGEDQLQTRFGSKLEKKIDQFNLDPTLKWELAEITQLDNSKIYFNLLSNEDKHKSGLILLNDLRWTISKNKSIKNKFKIGDIIFVKKTKIYGH